MWRRTEGGMGTDLGVDAVNQCQEHTGDVLWLVKEHSVVLHAEYDLFLNVIIK